MADAPTMSADGRPNLDPRLPELRREEPDRARREGVAALRQVRDGPAVAGQRDRRDVRPRGTDQRAGPGGDSGRRGAARAGSSARILEQLSREYPGRLKVVKVNVDENPRLQQRFGAMSIPTLVVLRDGKEVDRVVGAMPKPELTQRLFPHLLRR